VRLHEYEENARPFTRMLTLLIADMLRVLPPYTGVSRRHAPMLPAGAPFITLQLLLDADTKVAALRLRRPIRQP